MSQLVDSGRLHLRFSLLLRPRDEPNCADISACATALPRITCGCCRVDAVLKAIPRSCLVLRLMSLKPYFFFIIREERFFALDLTIGFAFPRIVSLLTLLNVQQIVGRELFIILGTPKNIGRGD